MKLALAFIVLASAPMTFAAKSYQVTGPVVEVTDTTITVDKKGEKFEIQKTATTTANVKKGDKVTIQYSMTATDVEVKSAGKETKEKK